MRIIGERRGKIRGQRTGHARDPNGFAQGRIVEREDHLAGRLRVRRGGFEIEHRGHRRGDADGGEVEFCRIRRPIDSNQSSTEARVADLQTNAPLMHLSGRLESGEIAWRPGAFLPRGGRNVQLVTGAVRRDRERVIPKAPTVSGAQQHGEFRRRRIVNVAHSRCLRALPKQRTGFCRRLEIVAQTIFRRGTRRASLAQFLRSLMVPRLRWRQRSRGATSHDGEAGGGKDESHDDGFERGRSGRSARSRKVVPFHIEISVGR